VPAHLAGARQVPVVVHQTQPACALHSAQSGQFKQEGVQRLLIVFGAVQAPLLTHETPVVSDSHQVQPLLEQPEQLK